MELVSLVNLKTIWFVDDKSLHAVWTQELISKFSDLSDIYTILLDIIGDLVPSSSELVSGILRNCACWQGKLVHIGCWNPTKKFCTLEKSFLPFRETSRWKINDNLKVSPLFALCLCLLMLLWLRKLNLFLSPFYAYLLSYAITLASNF